MERSTYYKGLILLMCFMFFIYFTFTNRYSFILKSLNINIFSTKVSRNLDSVSIYENLTIEPFPTNVSEFYPHLSIHIYTQPIPSYVNKSKLILLGNGFFGDRSWSLPGVNTNSTQTMIGLGCPFLSNFCDISTNMSRFSQADAVVYHMRDGIDRSFAEKNRHANQRLVFALWESPPHTPNLQPYRGFFNWTMSFRFESDIIASYYSGNAYVHKLSPYYELMINENRTKNLNLKFKTQDDRPSKEVLAKKKLGVAAALISNCGGTSKRLALINELKKYIKVDLYGRCGIGCPSGKNCREYIAENYYFLLSFENSLCTDYTTEKFFMALELPVVPVVLGRTNYSAFIPSSGYIDAREFKSTSALAKFLIETSSNEQKYLSYFDWKKDYVWGLGSFFSPFCDLCLRLHIDERPKIINNLQSWWSDETCQSPTLP